MRKNFQTKNGFGLLEVILSTALVSVLVMIFISAILDTQESVTLSEKRKTAVRIADSGIEAVRNIRDQNFFYLFDGNYGFVVVDNTLSLTPDSDLVDNIYTRTINISTIDSQTKKITSTVRWPQNERRNGEITLTTYLVNRTLP